MNKHDFYKQLMSEYTFDPEKIKNNAKKGRFARQKISPMAIGLTTAVAAATVVCGTLAFSMAGNRNGVDLVDTGSSALSSRTAEQRVLDAIEQQNKEQNSEEIKDVLVTFNLPISPAQAQDILACYADGSIPVTAIYMADGSRISGSRQVEAVFGGSEEISAVAVQCAGSVMSKLQADKDIFLVELLSESDFDTAVPIRPEDIETLDVQIPEREDIKDDTETDPQIKDPISDVIVIGTEETDTTDAVTEDTADIGTTDISDTAEGGTNETTDSCDSPDTSDTTDTPDEDTAENGETTDAPIIPETGEANDNNIDNGSADAPDAPVAAPVLPEGITLPVTPESYSYSSAYLGAESAFFLRNGMMYLRTANEVALYSFDGNTMKQAATAECADAKVHWVAENGGKMIVSGVDEYGMRNKLLLINADAYEIYDLNAEDIVMNGTLSDVGFNAETKKLVLSVKEDGVYYVCVSQVYDYNGSAEYIGAPFESAARPYLLSCTADTVYLAVADGTLTQVYAVNINSGELRIIKTYDNNPKMSHNLAFSHGIITPSATAFTGNVEIFDPAAETFIKTNYFNETLNFGASRHSFSVNGDVYNVSGGSVTATGGINALAPIDYRKSFSSLYAATADAGYVYITESIYNDKNRAGILNFNSIDENCSAEFREVLNGAIGMNNALALDMCRDAGILSRERLLECLDVYYSKAAVGKIMNLCSIPDSGALSYKAGVLSAINADDTILVISSTGSTSASGTLYIKAGSYSGKTAYRALSVTFAFENGGWKLCNIIG